MAEHPKQLQIPPNVWSDPKSAEVLRAWVVGGGLDVTLWTAFPEPDTWGILLVDVARHVARAYASELPISEQQALDGIRKMFDAEWDRPTDLGTTSTLKN
jgi:hypothetical protein